MLFFTCSSASISKGLSPHQGRLFRFEALDSRWTMRKLLGIGAVVLGGVGVLVCATAIGIGWWAAARTATRLDRIVARLDHGLSEVDRHLTRVELRVNAILAEVDAVREAAESIAAGNPELPRVQAQIEQLLDRLLPTLQRADALADSLRSAAAGLRTAADIVDQLTDDPTATVRVRSAAEKIDRAAETLNGLRARIEASTAAKAVRLAHEIGELAREAIAGSELLAEGLSAARQEITVVRRKMFEWRDAVAFWIYIAATANTLIWLWGGLSQLCLIGWGRRRIDGSSSPPLVRKDE
jgi:methyl-accepting chemotaxis protein